MNSFTIENYLKAIYKLGLTTNEGISTNDIAHSLNTKASSVTDMLKKLVTKKLVNYKKYYGVSLTDEGEKNALSIIRNHRLWEVFLVEKLHFKWNEVHEIAEQLEHVKSSKLIDYLDAYLDYPTVDPHGDPIPTKEGVINTIKKINLSKLSINDVSELVYVANDSDKFLKYLSKNKIEIGTNITITDVEPFDNSMTISYKNQQLVISQEVANNLYLKSE